MVKMSEKEFIEACKNIGIDLTEKQINQFKVYSSFLLEYNQKTNLTAIKEKNEVYLKHFFDSLLVAKFYKFNEEKVLDIGSGPGFPGVPLKITFPNIKLTVLDSNGKKIEFLKELKTKLNIDYEIINDRAEKYAKNARECFDIVTSRAVKSMPILAELTIPFVKIGGLMIAYKGKLDGSIENGKYAIDILGGKVEKIETTTLPIENAERTFVFVRKIKSTDKKYPRVFDKIIKKSLQK